MLLYTTSNYRTNATWQLANGMCHTMHSYIFYEWGGMMNSVPVDDWLVGLAIIASSEDE